MIIGPRNANWLGLISKDIGCPTAIALLVVLELSLDLPVLLDQQRVILTVAQAIWIGQRGLSAAAAALILHIVLLNGSRV
jgi:hypothetical protein